jgi:hypothetical protein
VTFRSPCRQRWRANIREQPPPGNGSTSSLPRDLSVDPRTLVVKRHHLHPSGVQKAITAAVHAAGMTKRATAPTPCALPSLTGLKRPVTSSTISNTSWGMPTFAPLSIPLKARRLPANAYAVPYPPEPEAALWRQRRDDHPNLHVRGAIGCIPPAGWCVLSSPSCHVGSPGGCFLTTSRHGRRSILPSSPAAGRDLDMVH